jgi:hypothetical protein
VAATTTVEGVLAIDNSTLPMTTELDFNVTGPAVTPAPEPTMHFCVDVLPVLLLKCAYSPACHGSPMSSSSGMALFPDGGPTFPAAGLVLDSAQGLIDTAIGHVAHGSNVGPMAGTPAAASCPTTNYSSCPFGVDMPIIDPGTNGSGNPGNSWLLYKTLLAVPPPTDDHLLAQCAPEQTYETTTNPPVAVSASERALLSMYILGREMPYPANPLVKEGNPVTSGTPVPLSTQELERVSLWIKQGAELETVTTMASDGTLEDAGLNCGMCQTITDSGAPPSDAGMDAPADAGTDASTDAPKG